MDAQQTRAGCSNVRPVSDTIGPIDFIVLEFPGNKFNGEVLPALVDLIAAGTIRILDLALVAKDDSGESVFGELEDLDGIGELSGLGAFLSDLISDEDLAGAAAELPNNSSALVIVWENTWAVPFVNAVRGSGGDVVTSGRLASSDVLAALEAE
jgi:uncharacterized membrane protein